MQFMQSLETEKGEGNSENVGSCKMWHKEKPCTYFVSLYKKEKLSKYIKKKA